MENESNIIIVYNSLLINAQEKDIIKNDYFKGYLLFCNPILCDSNGFRILNITHILNDLVEIISEFSVAEIEKSINIIINSILGLSININNCSDNTLFLLTVLIDFFLFKESELINLLHNNNYQRWMMYYNIIIHPNTFRLSDLELSYLYTGYKYSSSTNIDIQAKYLILELKCITKHIIYFKTNNHKCLHIIQKISSFIGTPDLNIEIKLIFLIFHMLFTFIKPINFPTLCKSCNKLLSRNLFKYIVKIPYITDIGVFVNCNKCYTVQLL
mgnify:CR=1 FL=1